jgi:dye decolorizing peroxidase
VLADLEPELASRPRTAHRHLWFRPGDCSRRARLTGQVTGTGWSRCPDSPVTGSRARWGDRDLVLQICGEDRTTVSHAPPRPSCVAGRDYARPSWTQTGFLDIPQGRRRNAGNTAQPLRVQGRHRQSAYRRRVRRPGVDQRGGGHPPVPDRRHLHDHPSDRLRHAAVGVRRPARPVRSRWAAPSSRATRCPVRRSMMTRDTAAVGADGTAGDRPERTYRPWPASHDGGHPAADAASGVQLRSAGHPVVRRRTGGTQDPVALSDTGLIFICFQPDPRTSFIPVQRRLAAGDRLNEWITHVGSAVFLVPAGHHGGGVLGRGAAGLTRRVKWSGNCDCHQVCDRLRLLCKEHTTRE